MSFLIALCIFIAIPLSARYKYNPFTRKLDYYEPVSGSDLGGLGDVTLTGLATGNVLYYNGTAWVNLATGANTNVLTLAGGVPTWAVAGAPAAHAASHEVGGADLVDHDQLTNYLAAQHLTLPNTIVAVLTDHNLAAHTALGLYDAPGDVDHDLTTNYVANQHIDHTAITFSAAGLITGGGTLAANRTFTLTEATIEAAIDSLPNLTSMQTPWTNVFVVDAGGGGDYTTIQAALNAQNAGGETFLVAPGTYTDTISFTANDQVVKPLGHVPNVIVTQADANIVDGGAWTDCLVEGIEIRLTAPTTAINAIQVGTGTLILIECRGYLATAVALAQADQPAIVGFTDAGVIRIKRGNYQYYHTGNTGVGGIKATFRANFNLAELHLHKIDVVIITNSGTALVSSIVSSTGTALTQMHNCIDIIVTDPNATSVIGLGYHGGAGAHNVQGNHVDVVATANTSYGIYHGGTATVRSSFNALHAQDTGGLSYAFYVGASATLNSHFDDLRSGDGNSIAGTFTQVSSPVDGDLGITDELDVLGVSEFSGDTNQYEDVFITWADAADHMVITQSAEVGIENQALVRITDDREDETTDEASESSLAIYAAGDNAFYVAAGQSTFGGDTLFQSDVVFIENVDLTWDDATDHMYIHQSSESGTEDQALVRIADAREGATVDEKGEATLRIESEGWGLVVIGKTYFEGDFGVVGDVTFEEDFFLTWAGTADHAVIAQTNTTGTDGQPLIFIDDDRTGTYADTIGEATIVIDAEGYYALYILDGQSWFATDTHFADQAWFNSNMTLAAGQSLFFGAQNAWLFQWDVNGAADDLLWFSSTLIDTASETAALFISDLNPNGMTDHDNYLSPTLVITNSEGADANDYSGVVIGERTQASVLVAHYFDFYAMTGAVDGATDPNATELAAIFRFGAAGTGTPTYATTPGDVLFEGSIEVDGNTQVAGYRRVDTVYWIDCFDHGTVANKYQWDWDIVSLSTQGNGTNTVDTTPSEITLTTDANGVGDNEGTRTEFAIIQRARQNRSEFEIELGQTANTQFYCGWNTSGTNAMVAAADEYVIVFFDESDNANWQIKVGDGTTEDVFTSGVAGAVSHIIHEIWVETDGTVHWRVNGTELDITGSVDNLMTANDHYLIVGQAQSVTGIAAIVVEIDYVENEKTKAH